MEDVCDMWKMTSMVQHKCQKNGLQTDTPLDKVALIGGAVQNGGKFYTFSEGEIAELLPKIMAITGR